MPRKQNFSYQKFQRENAKAMKREAKKERARSGEPEEPAMDLDRPLEGEADTDDERSPIAAPSATTDPE